MVSPVVATAGEHRREIVKMMAIGDASVGILDSNQVQVLVGGQVTILYIGKIFLQMLRKFITRKFKNTTVVTKVLLLAVYIAAQVVALFRCFERWTSSLTPVSLKQPRVSGACSTLSTVQRSGLEQASL